MTRRLEYATAAEEDLGAIAAYIAERSGERSMGEAYAAELRGRCRALAASPFILGRERNDCGEGRRSIAHDDYVIFFRVDAHLIRVIAILEGHQDVSPLVLERE